MSRRSNGYSPCAVARAHNPTKAVRTATDCNHELRASSRDIRCEDTTEVFSQNPDLCRGSGRAIPMQSRLQSTDSLSVRMNLTQSVRRSNRFLGPRWSRCERIQSVPLDNSAGNEIVRFSVLIRVQVESRNVIPDWS